MAIDTNRMTESASPEGFPCRRVAPVEYLKDVASYKVTVTNSSETLEELIGSALPEKTLACTLVIGDNAVRYNPVGEADATNSTLPTVFTIYGNKATLDTAEFYASSNVDIGVIVHTPSEEVATT